ncbi:MAG: hypothetical protein MUE91_07280 [Ignavibacteriaceae bacterium]|nr:hypothetical protein [Ignavibacteriaceae bacterium]
MKNKKEIPAKAEELQFIKDSIYQFINKNTGYKSSFILILIKGKTGSFKNIETGELHKINFDDLLYDYEVKKVEKNDSFDLSIKEQLLNDIREGRIESIEYYKDESNTVDGIDIVYKNKIDTIDCIVGHDETTKVIMTAFQEYQGKSFPRISR